MRIIDLFKLSTRMFKTRLVRTFLTILGVGVGIGAVLFLVSLGYGLQNTLLQRITTNEALSNVTVSNPTSSKTLYLNDKRTKEFLKIKNVKDVSPLASFSSQVTINDLTGNIVLNGIDSSYFKYAGVRIIEGEEFSEQEENSVIISESALKLFNVKEPKKALGKEVEFQLFITKDGKEETEMIEIVNIEGKYKIKGITDGMEASMVYFPLEVLKNYITIKKYDSAQIKVSSSDYIEEVKNELIDKGFTVFSLSETVDEVNKVFQIIQIVLGLFGAIALIVSSIGMANTMTVTLLERINEIGTMKSIGASDRDVGLIFLGESIIMGFLGGLSGIIIGIIGGELFNFGINFLASNFDGEKIDLFLSPWWFMGIIIGFSTIIGFITGIFPARHASKLNPLEALRYK